MSVKKSKGITLLESIISLFIAVITIMSVALAYTSINEGEENLREVMEGAYAMEVLKKILLCNYSYEYLKDILKDKKSYIDKEELLIIDLHYGEIIEVFKEVSTRYPRIEIQGKEGQGGTMIINIRYHLDEDSYLENIFYRGNYEEV